MITPRTNARGESFGRWLLLQRDRGDQVGRLANAARQDPSFPKDGSLYDAHRHLQKVQADEELFQALDDAEGDWMAA